MSTFQLACPKCHNVMWVTTGATTNCVACNAPLATAIAQASMGSGIPQLPSAPPGVDLAGLAVVNKLGASKPSARLVIFAVIGLVVVSIAGSALWFAFKKKLGLSTAQGNLAYAALGIDMKHGDPDQMIVALDAPAHRWANDAVWWSLNLAAIGSDGTMDLSDGGATVTYISPSRVADYAPSRRKDAIKDFNFGPAGVGYYMVKGARNRWENVRPPQHPGCSIKQLAALLHTTYGLAPGKTVRVSFDPTTSAMFGAEDGWHVIGQDPALTMTFSMRDCSVLKPN